MQQENFRAKDASKYLGIGRSTIWQYVRQGKLKAYKLSERVTIFKKEDLDNFINGTLEMAS
jgi:excisionase family DNA binding protein